MREGQKYPRFSRKVTWNPWWGCRPLDSLGCPCVINSRQTYLPGALTSYRQRNKTFAIIGQISFGRSYLRRSFVHPTWHVDSRSFAVHQSVGVLISSRRAFVKPSRKFADPAIILCSSYREEKQKRSAKMGELNNLDEWYRIAEELVLYAGKVRHYSNEIW